MSPNLSISLIIPAYNEAARLPAYLSECVAHLEEAFRGAFEIVVVNDGSQDQSDAVVKRAQRACSAIRLLSHERNRGKGAAVRMGMLAATGALRLFVDADGATPIGEFDKLHGAIRAGADAAIGSRAGPGGVRRFLAPCLWDRRNDESQSGQQWSGHSTPHARGASGLATEAERDTKVVWNVTRRRHVMGRIFAYLVRLSLGLKIHDTQCGFKLFTDRAADLLFSKMTLDGWLFDVELLYLASRLGLHIAEVPVNWHDVPGSKVHLLKHGWEMLRGLRTIQARHRGVHAISGRDLLRRHHEHDARQRTRRPTKMSKGNVRKS